MSKKEIIIKILIIIAIFTVGFLLRLDTIHLAGVSANEKAFYEGQDGLPYMYEMDSYYNYRLTKNYLDHGYIGDTIINGQQWDLHSYYPPGVPMDYPPLIVYLTAFVYGLINLFTSVPLLTVCFWLPAFIGPLCGIPAYFLVSKITNDYGGIFAGILAVTTPFYFVRSVPGWFDTDMFNILFPLFIVLFLFEAIQTKNRKMGIIYSILSAFSMFLFSIAWNGWQYLFYVISLFFVFYILYGKLKGKNIKNILNPFIIFFTVTVALISILSFSNMVNFVFGPLELIKISLHNPWIPWPNLYTSVSELAKPSSKDLIFGMGFILSGLTLFGILLIFRILRNDSLKERFLNKMDWFFFSFLIVWILAGIGTLTQGIRFILLLVPPLIITAGIAVGICVEYINALNGKKNLVKVLSILLVIVVTIPLVLNAHDNSPSLTPGIDDDLWNSAQWIKANTSNGTLIITSWSYGHFFSAIADRPVAFDGRTAYIETLPLREFYNGSVLNPQSPSTSREYWIDRSLATNNESLSLGILRMISTEGDNGYLTLNKYTCNTTKSVEILNNILGVDKGLAIKILTNTYKLSPEEAEDVLKYTHPDNLKPFVLVTYNGMIDIGAVTFKFGTWNLNNNSGENYVYSVGTLNISDGKLNSDNNISGNLNTNKVTWNGQIPFCEVLIKNNNVEKHYLNKNSDFCVFLLADSDTSIVLDKRFEDSVFTKLVLEKSNLAGFKPVYKNKNVIVWKTK